MTSLRMKWRRRRDLRHLSVYLIVLCAFTILGGGGFWILRTELLKNAQEMGESLARSYASEEWNNLTIYESLMAFGTQTLDVPIYDEGPQENPERWLQLYFKSIQSVLGKNTVDPYAVMDGKIVAANPWAGDETYDFTQAPWYRMAVAAEGGVIFTPAYTDAIYDKPVITIAQKCKFADAVLAFDIFPQNFQFQKNPLTLPEEASFYLCDSAGTLIYKQTILNLPDNEIQRYMNILVRSILNGEQDAYDSSIYDPNGNLRNVYYSIMPNGWLAIITIPYDTILGNLYRISILFIIFFFLSLLTIILILWRDFSLNRQVERTNETIRVLGNSYYALYRVDFERNTYEMIKGSDYVRSRLATKGSYEDLLRVMKEVIEPGAYKEYLESFSSESIRRLVAQRIQDFGGDFLRLFGDTYRWVNVRVLFDVSLAPGEVVLCFREVEQEKQRQLQERRLLENALETSRRSEKTKHAFFSNMSHDMRTPLNAIIGLSNLVSQHLNEPEKVAGYMEKISYSSRQLLDLINDILDMSRIEQGKVVLNNQQFNLQNCIEECVTMFRLQAEAEGKSFLVRYEIQNPEVLGDASRISQIMNNLLSNAFKFTSEGDDVSVDVRQFEDKEYSQYQIVVRDTGVGMSKEFLPLLFEPYARETRFTSRQISGTGLGMPIVKNLVTQMSGQINVTSELGKGTTFTVSMPLTVSQADVRATEREKAIPSHTFSLEGKKILLAEDNMVNMEIATEVLSMNGIKVVQAWNGVEAVEKFRTSQPFEFDAILMDMQMPQMDGCEATITIRVLSRPDAKIIPIIAVTANAFTEDIAATTAAGMNAHISKPIDFTILCQVLEKMTGRRS